MESISMCRVDAGFTQKNRENGRCWCEENKQRQVKDNWKIMIIHYVNYPDITCMKNISFSLTKGNRTINNKLGYSQTRGLSYSMTVM